MNDDPNMADAPEWRDQLAGRLDQLIGWAKAGQSPPWPAKAETYFMDAENVDSFRDDILRLVDGIVAEGAATRPASAAQAGERP